MVKITVVGVLVGCILTGCGGAPFSTASDLEHMGVGVAQDDAGSSIPTDDAGLPATDDAGMQAAQDVAPAPDAARDAGHDAAPDTTPDTGKAPEEDAAHVPDAAPDSMGAGNLCGSESARCLDGQTMQTCGVAGLWGPLTACQGACLNGACVACAPGGTAGCSECTNSGTQTCDATGSWGPCSASCS
jgi:hypothetical protein